LRTRLKPLNKNRDLELVMSWRSNPMIYKWFKLQNEPLVWNEHINYWKHRDDGLDFMILFENRKVGLISVSERYHNPEISIMIGEVSLWGKGIAKESIQNLTKKLKKVRTFTAIINYKNIGSQKLFESCGFSRKSTNQNDSEWLIYTYQRDEIL
jgi:RimJ/RimL family protein N-acetyltransferase